MEQEIWSATSIADTGTEDRMQRPPSIPAHLQEYVRKRMKKIKTECKNNEKLYLALSIRISKSYTMRKLTTVINDLNHADAGE